MNNQQKESVFGLIFVVAISALAGLMFFLNSRFLPSSVLKVVISVVILVFQVISYILAFMILNDHYKENKDTEKQNGKLKGIKILIIIDVVCLLAIIIGFICGLIVK